jgi:poly(3-hydroxybutyrate) depolymerase
VELVKPQDITTTALLTVEGELDDISGSGQTRAAHDLCSSIPTNQQQHMEAQGAGHYGIFSGRRWREAVYPAVKAFILESNKPLAEQIRAQAAPKNIATDTPVVAKPAPQKALEKAVAAAVSKPAVKSANKSATKSEPKATARPVAKAASKTAAKPAAKRTPAKTVRK